MNHETTSSFWHCYDKLPVDIRKLADKNFELLKKNAAAIANLSASRMDFSAF